MRFETTLTSEPRAAAVARGAVDGCLAAGVDTEVLEAVRLATSELIGNAIRHGRLRSGDDIRLCVELRDDIVRVVVEQPTSAHAEIVDAVDRSDASGYGLAIVDALSERWGVDGGDSGRVWFEVARS